MHSFSSPRRRRGEGGEGGGGRRERKRDGLTEQRERGEMEKRGGMVG